MLGAGDLLGEVALREGSPYSASVMAREDTRLFKLSPGMYNEVGMNLFFLPPFSCWGALHRVTPRTPYRVELQMRGK